MRGLLALLAVTALAPSSALGAQPEAGAGDLLDGVRVEITGPVPPQAPAATIALFVLAHRSVGTELTSLEYRDGGWTVRVRNTYACTHGIPGECRTFATAYFLVSDTAPHRFQGFGLP
jgi:hypothetical protein